MHGKAAANTTVAQRREAPSGLGQVRASQPCALLAACVLGPEESVRSAGLTPADAGTGIAARRRGHAGAV